MRLLAVMLGTALLAGCMNAPELTHKDWRVESINERPLIDRSYVSLNFENEQVSGSAGCNRWFSRYQLSSTALIIESPASTRKMCSPALMEQERRFLSALTHVKSWSINGYGQLELANSQGQIILLSPEKL